MGKDRQSWFTFVHCSYHLNPPSPQFGQLGPLYLLMTEKSTDDGNDGWNDDYDGDFDNVDAIDAKNYQKSYKFFRGTFTVFKGFCLFSCFWHFPNSILNKNTKNQIAMMKRCCWWGGRSGHVLYWLARRRGTNNVLLEIKREKCQNNKLTQFCTTIQFLLSPPPPTPHPRYGATISILHRSEPPKIRKDKFTSSRCILGDGQRMKCNLTQNFNFQGPQKEYLGKLQYELKYDFNTQARIMIIMDFIAVFVYMLGSEIWNTQNVSRRGFAPNVLHCVA